MKVNTVVLKNVLEILHTQQDAVTIVPSESGWAIQSIGMDNCTKVDITVSDKAFEDYAVWDTFAIDCDKVLTKLKNCGAKCEITLTNSRLNLHSDGLHQSTALLVANSTSRYGKKTLETDSECLVDVEHIRKFLKSCPEKTDLIRFSTTEERFVLYSAEDTGDSSEMTLTTDDCVVISGESVCKYGRKYLEGFVKVIPKGTLVDIKFSSDYPMSMDFGDADYTANWVIAPVIESDD